ncbi:phosphatase [Shewanella dokdonensis]|uniref:Phosphatase n=1 Tax=Shewanella dokdonensis TaxID=712036 RepID=A0ABX8DGU2_9GAMM|nr:phosphatase [Shewanella dokdonensis]MCL1073811.1 phosphatase [Shewanella dokdonensis]QVK23600.1 phosphatase [Shewanella dokdonensis]
MFSVDTHTHTIASTHAYSTVHDYLNVAKQRGIQLFALTDHGPAMADAPHFWHFVNLRVLPRVVDGVAILRGIEANICNAQGDIDYYGDYLAELDLVQAGFHEPVFPPADVAHHTEALLACIQSGNVDIITHPGNPRYPIEQELIVRAAAEHNVALEINNSSFVSSRKGSESNCLSIAKLAKQYDAQLVLGSDSHVAFTLGQFDEALKIIDAVGYSHQRLLNYSPNKLLNFLQTRGHRTVSDLLAYFA